MYYSTVLKNNKIIPNLILPHSQKQHRLNPLFNIASFSNSTPSPRAIISFISASTLKMPFFGYRSKKYQLWFFINQKKPSLEFYSIALHRDFSSLRKAPPVGSLHAKHGGIPNMKKNKQIRDFSVGDFIFGLRRQTQQTKLTPLVVNQRAVLELGNFFHAKHKLNQQIPFRLKISTNIEETYTKFFCTGKLPLAFTGKISKAKQNYAYRGILPVFPSFTIRKNHRGLLLRFAAMNPTGEDCFMQWSNTQNLKEQLKVPYKKTKIKTINNFYRLPFWLKKSKILLQKSLLSKLTQITHNLPTSHCVEFGHNLYGRDFPSSLGDFTQSEKLQPKAPPVGSRKSEASGISPSLSSRETDGLSPKHRGIPNLERNQQAKISSSRTSSMLRGDEPNGRSPQYEELGILGKNHRPKQWGKSLSSAYSRLENKNVGNFPAAIMGDKTQRILPQAMRYNSTQQLIDFSPSFQHWIKKKAILSNKNKNQMNSTILCSGSTGRFTDKLGSAYQFPPSEAGIARWFHICKAKMKSPTKKSPTEEIFAWRFSTSERIERSKSNKSKFLHFPPKVKVPPFSSLQSRNLSSGTSSTLRHSSSVSHELCNGENSRDDKSDERSPHRSSETNRLFSKHRGTLNRQNKSIKQHKNQEESKNNLEMTETSIIKRTALLKFLQILDGFYGLPVKNYQNNKMFNKLVLLCNKIVFLRKVSPVILGSSHMSFSNKRQIDFTYRLSLPFKIRENGHTCRFSAKWRFPPSRSMEGTDRLWFLETGKSSLQTSFIGFSSWKATNKNLHTKEWGTTQAWIFSRENLRFAYTRKRQAEISSVGNFRVGDFIFALRRRTQRAKPAQLVEKQRAISESGYPRIAEGNNFFDAKHRRNQHGTFLLWKFPGENRQMEPDIKKHFFYNYNYITNELTSQRLFHLLCVWPSYIIDILGPSYSNDSASFMLPKYFQLLSQGSNLKKQNITIIASTNNLKTLDPALLRPGRFDTIIDFSKAQPVGSWKNEASEHGGIPKHCIYKSQNSFIDKNSVMFDFTSPVITKGKSQREVMVGNPQTQPVGFPQAAQQEKSLPVNFLQSKTMGKNSQEIFENIRQWGQMTDEDFPVAIMRDETIRGLSEAWLLQKTDKQNHDLNNINRSISLIGKDFIYVSIFVQYKQYKSWWKNFKKSYLNNGNNVFIWNLGSLFRFKFTLPLFHLAHTLVNIFRSISFYALISKFWIYWNHLIYRLSSQALPVGSLQAKRASPVGLPRAKRRGSPRWGDPQALIFKKQQTKYKIDNYYPQIPNLIFYPFKQLENNSLNSTYQCTTNKAIEWDQKINENYNLSFFNDVYNEIVPKTNENLIMWEHLACYFIYGKIYQVFLDETMEESLPYKMEKISNDTLFLEPYRRLLFCSSNNLKIHPSRRATTFPLRETDDPSPFVYHKLHDDEFSAGQLPASEAMGKPPTWTGKNYTDKWKDEVINRRKIHRRTYSETKVQPIRSWKSEASEHRGIPKMSKNQSMLNKYNNIYNAKKKQLKYNNFAFFLSIILKRWTQFKKSSKFNDYLYPPYLNNSYPCNFNFSPCIVFQKTKDEVESKTTKHIEYNSSKNNNLWKNNRFTSCEEMKCNSISFLKINLPFVYDVITSDKMKKQTISDKFIPSLWAKPVKFLKTLRPENPRRFTFLRNRQTEPDIKQSNKIRPSLVSMIKCKPNLLGTAHCFPTSYAGIARWVPKSEATGKSPTEKYSTREIPTYGYTPIQTVISLMGKNDNLRRWGDLQAIGKSSSIEETYTGVSYTGNSRFDFLKKRPTESQKNNIKPLTWNNYKLCQFDTSIFVLIFYNIYYRFAIKISNDTLNFKFLKSLQWKKKNDILTFSTIRFLTPYKSVIFSHLLLAKNNGYSSKNLEILVYNKFKTFF